MKTYSLLRKFLTVPILSTLIAIPLISYAEEGDGKTACIRAYGQFFASQILKNEAGSENINCDLPLDMDRFFGAKRATTSTYISAPASATAIPVATTTPTVLKRKLAPIYVRPGISAANLTWTTKKPTKSTVFYSTSTPIEIGSDATKTSRLTTTETEHSVILTELESNTKYYVVITAEDIHGELLYSPEFYFTTSLSKEDIEKNSDSADESETFIEALLAFFTTKGVAATK